MEKREKMLLIILAVVGVIAVIVILVSLNPSKPAVTEMATELELASGQAQPSQNVEQLMSTVNTSKSVLSSDKFLMLTTFGKVPVTVKPDEMGKTSLF